MNARVLDSDRHINKAQLGLHHFVCHFVWFVRLAFGLAIHRKIVPFAGIFIHPHFSVLGFGGVMSVEVDQLAAFCWRLSSSAASTTIASSSAASSTIASSLAPSQCACRTVLTAIEGVREK